MKLKNDDNITEYNEEENENDEEKGKDKVPTNNENNNKKRKRYLKQIQLKKRIKWMLLVQEEVKELKI